MDLNSFGEWENGIKRYCYENGLDFEKAKRMSKRWGIDFLKLEYVDPSDMSAACVVLMIGRNSDGSPCVEQTEHTRKYLGAQGSIAV